MDAGGNAMSTLRLVLVVVFTAALTACGGGGGGGGGGEQPPPAAPSNILDAPLPEGALTLAGVNTTALNPRSSQLRFVLNGAEFDTSLADVTLTINAVAVSTASMTRTATQISANVTLADGRNDVSFKAYDTVGRPLYLNQTIWAGGNTFVVNVQGTTGATFTQSATVFLALGDDQSIGSSITTTTGTVTFQNIPSRTVVVTARSATGGLVGTAGAVGSEGGLSVRMAGFAPASSVQNNDLGLGLNGWTTTPGAATIVPHTESQKTEAPISPPPPRMAYERPALDAAMRAQRSAATKGDTVLGAVDDNDVQLTTGAEGPVSLSRTFATAAGTTAVVVRYRFITSEVPGGYFGSQYNDYFSVSLRSQNAGVIVSESNTMNGLGLAAFDAGGATAWRTVTLNTNSAGDVVQLDATVANVADGLFDSSIVIDFIAETQNKVRPALAWNSAAGGLTLTYTVEGSALTSPVTIEVYWASGPTLASRIGGAFFSHVVPAGTQAGAGAPVAIPGASLAADPAGTTHLLATTGTTQVNALADVRITYGANANAGVVSAGMIDVIKDGLRAAGQASATITSTARSASDQARAMFANLVNPANTVAANIANQLALYEAPGDAVINVFSSMTAGMTLAQINAAAASIRAAMTAQINSQGPSSVSRHCADPAVVSVVDVGASSFNASNGPLFVTSVTPRLSAFINEVATNNAYHLELIR
jgi:hypothetical protein